MKVTRVSSKINSNGFTTAIDRTKLTTAYPTNIWSSVPKDDRDILAQTVTYFTTRHLPLSTRKNISYQFPPPMARLFADYGFFYAMVEAAFEFPEKNLQTSNILRAVYNSEFAVTFNELPKKHTFPQSMKLSPKTIVMPISFGKDSLLTFALCRELGLSPKPIFIEEPTCVYQNKKKLALRRDFEKEFGVAITRFDNKLGSLRQPNGLMWGWDMLLLQYTTLLLPFVHHHRPQYFFWSNEQSTNESAKNTEEYVVNSTHEQSVQWTLNLNNLFRMFGLETTISSILEPLHELVILSILHKRYPEIGKYQLSCDGEKTKHRWCGNCFECARLFLFFSALGIDPKSVDLVDNMFAAKKRDLFYLFTPQSTSLDIVFQSYPERLLAFYLAYKRDVQGPLMEEFKQKLLPMVLRQKNTLFAKYLTVHESLTVPSVIKKPLDNIYREELARLRKDIT